MTTTNASKSKFASTSGFQTVCETLDIYDPEMMLLTLKLSKLLFYWKIQQMNSLGSLVYAIILHIQTTYWCKCSSKHCFNIYVCWCVVILRMQYSILKCNNPIAKCGFGARAYLVPQIIIWLIVTMCTFNGIVVKIHENNTKYQ